MRTVSNRPLTTPSDQRNDFLPITTSCFLGQKLAPCYSLDETRDNGDLQRECILKFYSGSPSFS